VTAVKCGEVAHDPEDRLLLGTDDMCHAYKLGGAAEFLRVPVAVTSATASPRRTSAPAQVSRPSPTLG
jgi:hypothetical protein